MKNKKKIIIKIVMFICLLGLIYSIYNIVDWHLANNKTEKIQEDIKEIIDDTSKDKNDIDFKALKEKNKDIVAYLKVNGTNIDYVVVKGKDNSYYLNQDNHRIMFITKDGTYYYHVFST